MPDNHGRARPVRCRLVRERRELDVVHAVPRGIGVFRPHERPNGVLCGPLRVGGLDCVHGMSPGIFVRDHDGEPRRVCSRSVQHGDSDELHILHGGELLPVHDHESRDYMSRRDVLGSGRHRVHPL